MTMFRRIVPAAKQTPTMCRRSIVNYPSQISPGVVREGYAEFNVPLPMYMKLDSIIQDWQSIHEGIRTPELNPSGKFTRELSPISVPVHDTDGNVQIVIDGNTGSNYYFEHVPSVQEMQETLSNVIAKLRNYL